MKKEFDKKFGTTWHCVVGRNFGSYVTHGTPRTPTHIAQCCVFRMTLACLQRPCGSKTDDRNASFYLLLHWPNRLPFIQVGLKLTGVNGGSLAVTWALW